jgi:demethylmenaquinone methyltransferase/2-methoxy-6-polyprenyl-1,4-benzoquinol methylase
MQKETDFGFKKVDPNKKTEMVKEVFDSVASKYDLMNDLMSLGVHRLWKSYAIGALRLKAGQSVLDLAGGTGDLTQAIHKQIGKQGHVVLSDINHNMLHHGYLRLVDKGLIEGINLATANAEHLPFNNNIFDRIIIGFGLRNVTDKFAALQEMYRVLSPGGQTMVLEFSHPTNALLSSIYDQYSFKILPKLGEIIAKDKESYQYLAESIRMHPDQDGLKNLMLSAGFDECKVTNLTGGIVAIHQGYKY